MSSLPLGFRGSSGVTTICRGSYIHPAVIGLAQLDEGARRARLAAATAPEVSGLRKLEPELIAFLRETPGP